MTNRNRPALPQIELVSPHNGETIQVPDNLLGYYAGFMSRAMAMAIDAIIISFAFVAITWFISVTATTFKVGSFFGLSTDVIPGSDIVVNLVTSSAIAGLVTLAAIVFYHVFFWIMTGQTPGKILLGLRVITTDGRRVPLTRALIRIAAYLVSILPFFLGFLWITVDDRRQAWHDKLAGTVVVYTWAARPDERFLAESIRQLGPPPVVLAPEEEAEEN